MYIDENYNGWTHKANEQIKNQIQLTWKENSWSTKLSWRDYSECKGEKTGEKLRQALQDCST